MINKEPIKIKKRWIDDASVFAEQSIETNINVYAKRNQKNLDKGKLDNRNGKIGEMVAFDFLKEFFDDLSAPDLTVYSVKNKSWEKDLISKVGGKKFGVKSQTIESAKKYGESWVFQNEDSGIHGDKDKKDDDNFIVFVLLDVAEKLGWIRGIVKVKWLHENGLFKPMKLLHLKSKRAVYYEDLAEHKKELWQIKF